MVDSNVIDIFLTNKNNKNNRLSSIKLQCTKKKENTHTPPAQTARAMCAASCPAASGLNQCDQHGNRDRQNDSQN